MTLCVLGSSSLHYFQWYVFMNIMIQRFYVHHNLNIYVGWKDICIYWPICIICYHYSIRKQ